MLAVVHFTSLLIDVIRLIFIKQHFQSWHIFYECGAKLKFQTFVLGQTIWAEKFWVLFWLFCIHSLFSIQKNRLRANSCDKVFWDTVDFNSIWWLIEIEITIGIKIRKEHSIRFSICYYKSCRLKNLQNMYCAHHISAKAFKMVSR